MKAVGRPIVPPSLLPLGGRHLSFRVACDYAPDPGARPPGPSCQEPIHHWCAQRYSPCCVLTSVALDRLSPHARNPFITVERKRS